MDDLIPFGAVRKFDNAYFGNTNSVRHSVEDRNIMQVLGRKKFYKYKAMQIYGGHCSNCGLSDYRFLALHHLNNDGNYRRRFENEPKGGELYAHLCSIYLDGIKRNDLDVLCYNCNWIERLEYEKTLEHNPRSEDNKMRRERIRLEVIKHYSGGTMSCKCCGYNDIRALQIDSIIPSSHNGVASYQFLPQENYPDGYQVLCVNCNLSKADNLDCSHKNKEDVWA